MDFFPCEGEGRYNIKKKVRLHAEGGNSDVQPQGKGRDMVTPVRFKLTTFGTGIRRSIH